MEMLKRLLLAHGLHESVAFHDVRWGGEHDGRFIWVLLNSGSAGAYAFNHDPDTLARRALLPAAARVLPDPRRHVRGREPARRDHVGARVARRRRARDGRRPRRGRGAPAVVARRVVGGHDAAVAVHGRRPAASAATTSWRTTRATTSRSRTATCSPTWSSCRAGSASACACCSAAVSAATRYVLGVDVGTGSARAGLLHDSTGRCVGRGEHPIETWHPEPDHVEQSSDDIWRAVCAAVRDAHRDAGVAAGDGRRHRVRRDVLARRARREGQAGHGQPATATTERNVIVWMDHRAIADAAAIDATRHPVLAVRRRVDLAGDGDAEAAVGQASTCRRRGDAPRTGSTFPTS